MGETCFHYISTKQQYLRTSLYNADFIEVCSSCSLIYIQRSIQLVKLRADFVDIKVLDLVKHDQQGASMQNELIAPASSSAKLSSSSAPWVEEKVITGPVTDILPHRIEEAWVRSLVRRRPVVAAHVREYA